MIELSADGRHYIITFCVPAVEFKAVAKDRFPQIRLTPREIQVVELIRRGYQNKEIAAELRMTLRTAKFHVSSILIKLDLRSRYDLYNLAPGKPV